MTCQQLHAISLLTCGRSAAQLVRTDIGVSGCLAAQEDDHLSNDFVLHQPSRAGGVPFLKSQADPLMISPTPSSIRFSWPRACLFHIRRVGGEPAQEGVALVTAAGDRLIHFRGQGSSQLSHGGYPADVCEIRLRLAQRLFSLLALGENRP